MEWLVSLRPRDGLGRAGGVDDAGSDTPVDTPISSNMLIRSSEAMFPVDPAGTGQPPSSPKLDSKLMQPTSKCTAYALASPWPRVLWKCG